MCSWKTFPLYLGTIWKSSAIVEEEQPPQNLFICLNKIAPKSLCCIVSNVHVQFDISMSLTISRIVKMSTTPKAIALCLIDHKISHGISLILSPTTGSQLFHSILFTIVGKA